MKKRTIVIASVLKPIDDTRMFEKMAQTLADAGGYEIFIIGYPSASKPNHPSVQFKPLSSFPRISLKRFLAPMEIFKKIREVKPDVLIVNTHELLIVGLLNRILFGVSIVYDIRENYYRNILHTETFPWLVRPALSLWVRAKEKLSALFFHWFFLAEKGYQNEFSFFRNRFTIIENKARLLPGLMRSQSGGYSRLLFTGTLAESTGVFEAIRLSKQLHSMDSSIRLIIIGYCAKPAILNRIRSAIRDQSFISLEGGDELVPHAHIIKAICSADFGIICYPPSRHTENSIPTKLYEYLTYQLPLLVQDHPAWIDLISPSRAGIPVHFPTANIPDLLESMKSGQFYIKSPGEVTWESEAPKLLQALKAIKTT